MIKDHPMIGREVDFEHGSKTVRGTVTGVRKGRMLLDIKTGRTNSDTEELRIKPNNGGRAFWTPPMAVVPERSCE